MARGHARVKPTRPLGVRPDAGDVVLELGREVLAVPAREAQIRAVTLPVGVRADVDVPDVSRRDLDSGIGLNSQKCVSHGACLAQR